MSYPQTTYPEVVSSAYTPARHWRLLSLAAAGIAGLLTGVSIVYAVFPKTGERTVVPGGRRSTSDAASQPPIGAVETRTSTVAAAGHFNATPVNLASAAQPMPLVPATPPPPNATTSAVTENAASQTGLRTIPGRVAYFRCDKTSASTPCPRDLSMEAATWSALRLLPKRCAHPALEAGPWELRLDRQPQRPISIDLRRADGRPLSPADRLAISECVRNHMNGDGLRSTSKQGTATRSLISFRFELLF